jgi:hypothetical protein
MTTKKGYNLKELSIELKNIAGSVGSTYSTVTIESAWHSVDEEPTISIRLYIDKYGSVSGTDVDAVFSELRDRVYGTKSTIDNLIVEI